MLRYIISCKIFLLIVNYIDIIIQIYNKSNLLNRNCYMKNLGKLFSIENEAINIGFKWPNADMILDQVKEEAEEVRDAIDNKESNLRIAEEVGDLLHIVISLTRFLDLDVDKLLDNSTQKFSKRLNALKIVMQKYNIDNLENHDIKFLLKCWNEAKEYEN